MTIDPSRLNIQTGPGEPAWHWNRYELHNSGPVLSDQPLELTLLSVWPTRIFRTLRLVLIHAALFLLVQPLLPRRLQS